MGFFAHDFCFTSGKAGFAMGRKAQWESAFSYGTSSSKGNTCRARTTIVDKAYQDRPHIKRALSEDATG